jgi:hypothetical protein
LVEHVLALGEDEGGGGEKDGGGGEEDDETEPGRLDLGE